MTPTFTVLIGSIGRDSLRYTLDSIARQEPAPGDQCIVAIDSFEHGDRPDVQALVHGYGERFQACAYDSGYHWLGVEQINWAMTHLPLTGTHVLTLGDDDVLVDGAYAVLRRHCAADMRRPVLHRFLSPWREILWDEPRMAMSRISGCCIAAPAAYVRPMPTRQYVEHDYDWMADILARSPSAPLWLDEVLVIARPDERGKDVTHQGLLRCWRCTRWGFLEDVDRKDPRCRHCQSVVAVREVAA